MKKSIAMFCCLALAAVAVYAQDDKEKAPPPPPPPPKIEVVKERPPVIVRDSDLKDFYDRNPAIAEINWRSPDKVIIVFKDRVKKPEQYNLANKEEEISFSEKYGDTPRPLAPPPPPPPKPKKTVQ